MTCIKPSIFFVFSGCFYFLFIVFNNFDPNFVEELEEVKTQDANSESAENIILPKVEVFFQRHVLDGPMPDVRNYLVRELGWNKDVFTDLVAKCRATCNSSISESVVLSDERCLTHPLVISDTNFVKNKDLDGVIRAQATLPCFLELRQSKIPNANRGVFTTMGISSGILFGPYQGTIVTSGNETENAQDSGYSWKVSKLDEKGQDATFYVDGAKENSSNWMRYVNSARYEEEQNLYPLEFDFSIYYFVYKNVPENGELLVWYGQDYAKWMGIEVTEEGEKTHNWVKDFAPKKNIVICPTCDFNEESLNEESLNEYKADDNNHSIVENAQEKIDL